MKKYIYSILAFIFAVSCFAQNNGKHSFLEEYEVTTPLKLKANTSDGDITVHSYEKNVLLVKYIIKKGNEPVQISKNELLNHVDIDVLNENGYIEIMIREKESEKMKKWNERYHVSLDISTPVQTSCKLHTSDGDISIDNLKSDQYAQTSDGDIRLSKIDGNISGRSSDGDVNINNINGSVDFSTSDGDISIHNVNGYTKIRTSDGDLVMDQIKGMIVATTSDGNIEARDIIGNTECRTSDGSIRIYGQTGILDAKTSDGNINFENLKGSATINTSDGDIEGNITELENHLSIHAVDGDVEVTIPGNSGLDLYLKGENIHTRLQDFSGTSEEHLIRGQMSGGGKSVEISCSDGDINLYFN